MNTALPLLQADWPTPPGVHALTTRRHGAWS
ncbi:multi-copper polyphenol oxidoreductase, partial [Stenotrophomonas sp. HMWF022]